MRKKACVSGESKGKEQESKCVIRDKKKAVSVSRMDGENVRMRTWTILSNISSLRHTYSTRLS